MNPKQKQTSNEYESDFELDPPKYSIKSLSDLLVIATEYAKDPSKYENNKDLEKLTTITKEIQALENMIGLQSLKKQIMFQIMMACQGFSGDTMMHTALMGPPGVGKTTVAKIIAKIYSKVGILKKQTIKVVGLSLIHI